MAFLHYLKRLSGFQKGTFMELVIWLAGLFHRSVSELKDNTRRTHKLLRPPYLKFILQTLRKERIMKWTVHISNLVAVCRTLVLCKRVRSYEFFFLYEIVFTPPLTVPSSSHARSFNNMRVPFYHILLRFPNSTVNTTPSSCK